MEDPEEAGEEAAAEVEGAAEELEGAGVCVRVCGFDVTVHQDSCAYVSRQENIRNDQA